MDVAVHWIRRIERLRQSATSSLLGEGILERARSTTLALLGVTAAVGLSIVALVLQQGWPVVPGSGLPGLPGPEASVDPAIEVGTPQRRADVAAARGTRRAGPGAPASSTDRDGGGSAPSPPSGQLALAGSTQVGDGSGGSDPSPGGGDEAQPQQPPAAKRPQQPKPAAQPVSQPVSAPEANGPEPDDEESGESPPVATAAGVDEDDDDSKWPWSNGKGHGHDDDDDDHDWDDDDDDDHGWHYGRGRGH